MRTVFIIFLLWLLTSCGVETATESVTVDLTRLGTIQKPDEGPFGSLHRMASGKDGQLYVSDSANGQIIAFDRNGKLIAQTGRLGPGPGEFEDGPGALIWHLDSLYVTEGATRKIHVFDRELRFIRSVVSPVPSFRPEELVSESGNLFGGGYGGSYDTRLVKLTDSLTSYESIPLAQSHHDLAWDLFVLDSTDEHIVVAFLFRNVVEVHPIDAGQPWSFTVETDAPLPEPPPIQEDAILSENADMPQKPYIWRIATDSNGWIYLLTYDFTANPERDVLVYDLDGTHLTTFTLPEPAQRIYIDQQDRLYAATKERTELTMYEMDFTSVD
jgi:hypothetical protein